MEPQGEDLRKAVKWICEMREADAEANLFALVEKACIQFNLCPKDEEFLIRFFRENKS